MKVAGRESMLDCASNKTPAFLSGQRKGILATNNSFSSRYFQLINSLSEVPLMTTIDVSALGVSSVSALPLDLSPQCLLVSLFIK